MFQGFCQKLEKNDIRFKYTMLPLTPLPEEISTFYLELDLSKLHKTAKPDQDQALLEKQFRFWTLKKSENEGVKIKVKALGYESSISTITSSKTVKRNGEDVKIPIWSAKITYRYPLKYELYLPGAATPFMSGIEGKEYSALHTSYFESEGEAMNASASGITLSSLYSGRQSLFSKESKGIGRRIMTEIDFPQASHGIEILTLKKHKKFMYPELDKAFSIAQEAFVFYKAEDKSMPAECREKLSESIEIWNKSLDQFEPNNKKARVNDKIAGAIYQNLFICYTLMHEFDQAAEIKNTADSKVKGQSIDRMWLSDYEDRKKRVAANPS